MKPSLSLHQPAGVLVDRTHDQSLNAQRPRVDAWIRGRLPDTADKSSRGPVTSGHRSPWHLSAKLHAGAWFSRQRRMLQAVYSQGPRELDAERAERVRCPATATQRRQAFTGMPIFSHVFGRLEDGTIYSDFMVGGRGQGGSIRQDEKSGLLLPTSASNTSIEVFEARIPAMVLEKAYVQHSGALRKHRTVLASDSGCASPLTVDFGCRYPSFPKAPIIPSAVCSGREGHGQQGCHFG